MRNRNMLMVLAMGLGLLGVSGWGQIPTVAERIRDSGRNPELCTWKAEKIRLSWPPPKRETNQPPLAACYRHDFNLVTKPRQAAITLMSWPTRYSLKVNGQVVAEQLPVPLLKAPRDFDIARFLCAGRNVITVKMDDSANYGHLLAEGIVFGEDGSTVRLLTDKTWKGGWDLSTGWDKPETDPTNLPPVEALRIYKWSTEGEMNPPYYGPIQVAPIGPAGKEMSQPLFDEEKVADLKVTVMNGAAYVGEQKSENIEHRTSNAERRTNTETQASYFPASPINHKPLPILTYEIFDENSRKVMGTNVVALTPEGKLDLASKVKVGPLPQGCYRFRFVLAVGTNEVDRRDYEVVSVGVIKQRLVEGTSYEEGLELKKIWSVDCTADPDPKTFVARYANAASKKDRDIVSIVTNGPAGRYRTLEQNGQARYFAYRFKVQRLFVPHLAVVEWPDDAPRNFQVHIMEGTSMISGAYLWSAGGWARGEAAVRHVDRYPFSNRMQKLHILYWPNEEDESVHIFNLGGSAGSAAAARVTVYEIINDIPALKIAEPTPSVSRRTTQAKCGDRLIGYQTERGPHIMAGTYYAGPLGRFFTEYLHGIEHPEFYRSWYTTTQNMIKRMKFSGQNLCLMGHFMYNHALYPSARRAGIYSNIKRDSNGIILRMFERNGMSMISGFEYMNTPDLIEASPATPEQVRAGAPTLFCVGKDGNFGGGHGGGKGVNYIHPQVQESVLALVGELAELYKEYPAWKGVAFLLSCNFGPMAQANMTDKDDPLNWGYEDYTFDLFQKETGISIPVRPPFDSAGSTALTTGQGRQDPDRFQKRYDRLMANPAERDKWIDWRCAQYTNLYRKMRDRLVKARPDLKLYLFDSEPMVYSPKSQQDLVGHLDDQAAMTHVLKTFGFDAETLKKENGMVISYVYLSPGTHHAACAKTRMYEDITLSQGWHDLFANDGKGGAYIWSGFEEWHMTGDGFVGGAAFAPGEWPFQFSQSSQAYSWPKGAYLNGAFVNVLVRSDPTVMPHTFIDVNDPGSRLHEMRLFARAYRSLPSGKYERLTGNGLDKNIWVKSHRVKDGEYAYAANADWWEMDVTLTFAPGVKVHDLIKDQPVKLKQGCWTFHLGPYEVQTFRVTGGGGKPGSAIVGSSTILPKAAASVVREALQRGEQVVARARAREAELREMPGWTAMTNLEDAIKKIQVLLAAGDLARAYEMLTSGESLRAQSQVVNEALDAIPFLVLGPFGDPKDTEGAGKVMGNCEVVPEFRGMETAFIGESRPVDLNVLVADFQPDRSKSYRVYPDKEAKWQTAIKTYYLSFCPKACSEPPLWMTAYAYTEVYSPAARDAAVWVGSDHALWIWLNDRLVFKHGGQGTPRGGQRPSAPDQNRGEVKLQAGWNRILVKAVQRGETRIFFRITGADAKPLADLRFRAPAA